MGLFDDVSKRVSRAASSVSASGAATGVMKAAVGKFAPKYYGAASKLMNGDPLGAVISLAKSKIGNFTNNPLLSNFLFNTMRNQLLGGLTPSEAQRISAEVQSTQYAKRNLFFLEVLDFFPTEGGAQQGGDNLFNLFATSVSFAPITIGGESKQIGSGMIDGVTGRERLELRITTYDDASGSIKRWFDSRANSVARPDGTFGVPADYLVQVRILHAALNDDVMKRFGGYERKFIMRPASMEHELSRTEDNLEEIQITFSQFDTFMFNEARP